MLTRRSFLSFLGMAPVAAAVAPAAAATDALTMGGIDWGRVHVGPIVGSFEMSARAVSVDRIGLEVPSTVCRVMAKYADGTKEPIGFFKDVYDSPPIEPSALEGFDAG